MGVRDIDIVVCIPDHAVDWFADKISDSNEFTWGVDIGEQSVPGKLYAGNKVEFVAHGLNRYTSSLAHWQYTEDELNDKKILLLDLQFVRTKPLDLSASAIRSFRGYRYATELLEESSVARRGQSASALKMRVSSGEVERYSGTMYSHCIRCNRPLKKKESQKEGFGPSCKALYIKEMGERAQSSGEQMELQL